MARVRSEEFERLYAEHAAPLLAFLTYRTGDRTVAEDLVAETFEKVLRARRGFDRRRGGEKTWLYTIALNAVRDSYRRQEAERRAVSRGADLSGDDPSDPFAQVEHREGLAAALATLTAEEREAVALRYGSDLTVPEIAKLTRTSLTTIEGRVYRALRKLRAEMSQPH